MQCLNSAASVTHIIHYIDIIAKSQSLLLSKSFGCGCYFSPINRFPGQKCTIKNFDNKPSFKVYNSLYNYLLSSTFIGKDLVFGLLKNLEEEHKSTENLMWFENDSCMKMGTADSKSEERLGSNNSMDGLPTSSLNIGDGAGTSRFSHHDAVRRSTNSEEAKNLLAHYVPVYVMLPLDVISKDNKLLDPERLLVNLNALKAAGVDGIMADVWWGIAEAKAPKQYDWSAYRELLKLIQSVGLKIQVVMSFHQCGGNTGDTCFIPLPPWILEISESCPDIFFANRDNMRNQEYLSFGVDDEPVLHGRNAVQVYYDFMHSFRVNFEDFLNSGIITEVEVGLGPAGELRFPSYPATHGWRFPGIGEFQCYDRFLLDQLKDAAKQVGQYDWGYSGPHDAGRYNDWPQSTGFFCNQGSFASDYGRFFLEWYSSVLLNHGDRVLEAATNAFVGCKTKLAAKVAGIHWWYNSKNHAAELAAGYYNLRERDGYEPIAKMLARHNATLNFTCAEMRDEEHYWEARCGPEGLVQQVLRAGWNEGLDVACENALPRYDATAFNQIISNARPTGISKEAPPKNRISSFTFLRLCSDLFQEAHWNNFIRFVRTMHAGLDHHPHPEQFWRPHGILRRSKPKVAISPSSPRTPIASFPLNPSSIPFSPGMNPETFFSTDAPGGGLGMHVGEISSCSNFPFMPPQTSSTLNGSISCPFPSPPLNSSLKEHQGRNATSDAQTSENG